jgi:hypothetical protein
MQGRKFGGALLLGMVGLVGMGRADAVIIGAGSASGAAGTVVSIDVTLASEGEQVIATQNRIDYPPQTRIAAADGQPACAVNPAIDKNATGFRFHPLGCDPATTCTSVRVFVLAFDNLEPIADGSRLYTCDVQIAADAPAGIYPLTVTELGASAAGGVVLPTSGVDGAVTVVSPPAAQVVIGSAAGEPGETVQVDVTLALLDANARIAGVQADFAFDPATPVAATAADRPDCTLDTAISIGAESFTFLPPGCTPGGDCSGVHALVLGNGSAPFADGALLYRCAVAIRPDAPAGTYDLTAGPVLGSDPEGDPVTLTAADGSITVDEPPPPPACLGDCDGSRDVSINELLVGVNILLGFGPSGQCLAVDGNGDGSVSVDELVRAVSAALNGCPT